jgi:enoyl-[acyl-carrier protein] reductase II
MEQARTQPPIGSTIVGGQTLPMPRFSIILPMPSTTGDFEEMCLTAGESCGNITTVKSAREIVREMEHEALDLLTWRLQAIVPELDLPVVG